MSRTAKGNSAIQKPGSKPNGYFYAKDGLKQNIPMITPPTQEQKRKAGLIVAQHSRDTEEAVTLLKMLGLIK